MMKPANCKICGRVFLKSIGEICPDCIKKEQDLIRDINDYCFGKTTVTLAELSQEFGESTTKLEKHLLDRKLVQVMDKLDLICKGCGVHYRILNEGRLYCRTCFDKFETGLASAQLEGYINPATNKPYYRS